MRSSTKTRIVTLIFAIFAIAVAGSIAPNAVAQSPGGGWTTDLDVKTAPATPKTQSPPDAGTTVVKKKVPDPAPPSGTGSVRLVALLTADGQRIENDLIWRIYEESSTPGTAGKLIATHEAASPVVNLPPGSYMVNAAFGRAHITRKLVVRAGTEATEPFVLNAGALRLKIAVAQAKMDAVKALFEIQSDERDQRGNRSTILSRAKPGVVIRLNSGIYHIVSTLGDANATVEADVTVEAGKLTEAAVSHKAGRVTLKLVTRQGGEALPDTEWTVLSPDGHPVKTSVGALPTHILAPGEYFAVAKSQGKVYRRGFSIGDGESTQIEVLKQ